MKDSGTGKHTIASLRTILLRTLLILFSVCGLAVLALKLYLNTPHAAALASRQITSFLDQPVRIANLRTSGVSFTLNGVSVGNPPGMTPGNLVEVDSLTIAPSWGNLLLGKRHLRILTLVGLRLDVRKNDAGVWNFSELQKRFADKKSAGSELFIGRFSLTDGSIQVNGQGAKGISLQLSNLSTKGSGDARINLSFEDAARNKYALTGTARSGNAPAFELTLAAPALSFSGVYGLLNRKANPLLEGVNGGMKVTAKLHAGLLQVTGNLDFDRPSTLTSASVPPLAGSLTLAAGYDTSKDELRLDALTLAVNDLIRAHASGTAALLKSERRFNVDIGLDRVDLARLTFLLPDKERQKTLIGGSLASSAVHLSGNAVQGVTKATGQLQLHDGSLEREGQLYFKGLGATAALSGSRAGFQVNGKLSLQSPSGSALLENLNAPFGITLSNRLKLITAEMPSLTAGSRGVRVSGRLAFTPAATTPLAIALRATSPNASTLQPLLGKRDLQIASGAGSLSLDAAGRGLRDFSAAATARFTNLQGTQNSRKLVLKGGVVDSRLTRKDGKLSVTGKAAFDGMVRDGKAGDARFSFRFGDGVAVIENSRISFAGTSLAIARLSTRLSPQESGATGFRYPLQVEISGGEVQRGEVELNSLSGVFRGAIASDPRGRWLEGTADLSTKHVAWQGKPVAAPVVHASFSRTDVRAAVSGMLLGGTVTGDVDLQPAASAAGAGFRFRAKGVSLSQVGKILPRSGTTVLSDGTLDASVSGSYSSDKGLVSRIDLAGAGISVSGSGGKTVLAGGGLTLAAELSGANLAISNALFKAGEEVSLKLNGEVKNPLTARREGQISYSVQRTALNSLINPFVNLLPRFIQEATVDGSLASEGTIVLRDGSQLLEGEVQFTDVLLEVQSQKFKAGTINGRLPFSLDLSGKKTSKAPGQIRFSRENYPRLLDQLRADSGTGRLLSIGSVSFGTINLGEVQLRVSAAEGMTKLVSLRSSLYEGAILGTGFVAIRNGINYRTDLLINGLSLKQFCATIPKIKDYISGRLDGVVSLSGAGKGVAGLTGFTDLWAREGGGEKMLVSKTFLQKLSGKKLSGFFFRSDRPFDQAEISAVLQDGYLTFEKLDISNTNLFGVRDLSVTVASAQNRIALDHLFNAVKQAAERGKTAAGEPKPDQAPVEPEFKWQE